MKKRTDVLTYFKETKANIVCLQDTHWTETDLPSVSQIWGNRCYIHGSKTNARGVAILFRNNFEYEILASNSDKEGNLICLTVKTSSVTFNLLTLYGPNTDNPSFFRDIKNTVQENNPDYYVICGDFNMVLNPKIDCNNYKHINNPKARSEVLNMNAELNLTDIFRNFHPQSPRYTWRTRNPVKQARLDFFLVSNSMIDLINQCYIKAGYQSDHSIVFLEIAENKFQIGKGIWKFNNSLLKNKDYLDLINRIIDEEIIN